MTCRGFRLVMLLFGFVYAARPQSKAEWTARLAAAEAARIKLNAALATSNREKASLAASLNKLGAGATERTAVTQKASDAAAVNAMLAEATARINAEAQKQTAETAERAAAIATANAHAQVSTVLIVQVAGFSTVLAGLLVGLWGVRVKAKTDRRWFLEDAAAHWAEILASMSETKSVVEKLAVRTDGALSKLLEAKDALRESTNAAQFAKGVEQGETDANALSPTQVRV